MRPAQLLLEAAKKQSGSKIPVELTPLFVAMGVALCSGTYFTYKKFCYDDSLRVSKNPEQSGLAHILEEKK
ncbi:hypothetical protein TPHA_0H00530 [Tetrapisispora phaffii CBS 4417]|uniref:Uncharacterized protein n=1 Tax=Tetrapisispora phaffii (strain ATCC 24235 / CBS 4417 / NBRC 1672 / NRRL Y-8282 / UCD 70-5) TaxID=1071381 RepID=G8BWV9_TETPH|nr:hypothetical protein TPHA_0H00530 [Tetrapisispora phaffii CBS 4417]CCE64263.1 hypothetical protein TPHA_0H00530 [Tetrapisispora phaffii CBS 4417]